MCPPNDVLGEEVVKLDWVTVVIRSVDVKGNFCIFGKRQIMTVSDLKLKLFRQIDSLEKDRLEELYGVFLNYINGKKDLGDWNELTEEQKKGIVEAIDEIDAGKGIPHSKVIASIRKKYTNA